MKKEFIEGMASILEVNVEEITENTVLDEAVWDSLAVVSTLTLIDKIYDDVIDPEKLLDCSTIGQVHELISK